MLHVCFLFYDVFFQVLGFFFYTYVLELALKFVFKYRITLLWILTDYCGLRSREILLQGFFGSALEIF